jgi:tetratricopeptide (TPR) repeat protein
LGLRPPANKAPLRALKMTDNDEAPPWETDPEWLCQRKIYGLIYHDRYDEAKLAIEEMRKEFPHLEPHNFIPFYASIERRLGNPETAIQMLQQAVKEGPDLTSHHHRLGAALIDAERWAEADLSFQQLIAICLARDEFYFLNDARYRRALCLKALGRREDLEKVKAEIPDSFYDSWLYRIEDVS